MTSALETIRYHSGIAGEEVADMVDSLEREIISLREQVEKLTKDQKDAERLNYLQEHGATVHLVPTTNSNLLSFVIGGLHRSKRLNLREAIDAAMQEDKP